MTAESASLFERLRADVHLALKQWHATTDTSAPLHHLYIYRKLARRDPENPRRVTNQLLLQALAQLRTTYEADADLLQARFLDRKSVVHVAHRLNHGESTIYVQQRQAIDRLTETVATMESEATIQREATLLQRLEPKSYSTLLGLEEMVAQLTTLVAAAEPPWMIAIEGLGGIGKTSLADALLRHLIRSNIVDEVAWVSARARWLKFSGDIAPAPKPALTAEELIGKLVEQLLPHLPQSAPLEHTLPLLRTHLQSTPHVIVVDNLETLTDVESLLPTLQTLANPSKFIITSRHSFYSEPNLYHLPVRELSPAVAYQLIRQEAENSNLPEFANSPDAELQPIYETVGGNPLALRLVVGQVHFYSLPSILHGLHEARGHSAENLYEFIYRKAWENLDPLSRQALLIMPLASPGGDEIDYLAEVGDLAVDELRAALSKLIVLNLVDARGGMYDRRYSIHGLTRTFLQEQVAKWF